MPQMTRKGDKFHHNMSKTDYKVVEPVKSDATTEPPMKRIEGEGSGKGRAARRESPYKKGSKDAE
jgi:hypothetical protein